MGMLNIFKKKDKSAKDTSSPASEMPALPEIPEAPNSVSSQVSAAQSTEQNTLPELPENSTSSTEQTATEQQKPVDQGSSGSVEDDLITAEMNQEVNVNSQNTGMSAESADQGVELPSFNAELDSVNSTEEKSPAPTEDSFDFELPQSAEISDTDLDSLPSLDDSSISQDNNNPLESLSLDIPTTFNESSDSTDVTSDMPDFHKHDEDVSQEIQSAPEGPHYVNVDVFEEMIGVISISKQDAEVSLDIAEEYGNTNSRVSKSFDELHSSLLTLHKKLQLIDKKIFEEDRI